MSPEALHEQVERLRSRAADIAAPLARAARSRITVAQERATLRMLGVDGLDRAGRPLASSVVEVYCGGRPELLASGVALPFAAALIQYGVAPRDLAIDVAAGDIDLVLEAAALGTPDGASAARAMIGRLIAEAANRFDQNRTAGRELRDVLGETAGSWLAVTIGADDWRAATGETRGSVEDGAALIRIRVPASWELLEARREPDQRVPVVPQRRFVRRGRQTIEIEAMVRPSSDRWQDREGGVLEDDAPPGSQRGLAQIRIAADQAAARVGRYVSLMTVGSPFSAPEQAVVAAFERVDVVEADPLREIVEGNVDPDRALADHAFANRLLARSGCALFAGSGPLAIGPELTTGLPADRDTRAGRSLALQALGVELALANGIASKHLVVGAVPEWVAEDGDPGAVAVEAWLRGVVFPDHPLVVAEPAPVHAAPRAYPIVAALAALARRGARSGRRRSPRPLTFLRQPLSARDRGVAALDLAMADETAGVIAEALGDGELHGDSLAVARRVVQGAIETLERLDGQGWGSILGPETSDERRSLGGGAVVERCGDFDVAELLEARPLPA